MSERELPSNDNPTDSDESSPLKRVRESLGTLKSKHYKVLALNTLIDLLNSSDDKVRLQAAQTLLQHDVPLAPVKKVIDKFKR